MTEPLYLTDAERPLRPLEQQARYAHYAEFDWRGVRYTRWFTDPTTRRAYLENLPDCRLLSSGEARPADAILEGLNK